MVVFFRRDHLLLLITNLLCILLSLTHVILSKAKDLTVRFIQMITSYRCNIKEKSALSDSSLTFRMTFFVPFFSFVYGGDGG